MKKIFAVILVSALALTACSSTYKDQKTTAINETPLDMTGSESTIYQTEEEYLDSLSFSGLDDPALLQLIGDNVYAGLTNELESEEYRIDEVRAIYISKEYMEDLEHNSKENIFFGYSLSNLELQFEGTKFEFTTDENGNTIVREFEEYDDTYERILANVAIGAGVIIVLVVVTVATAGSDIPAVAAVCAISGAAAKGAAIGAASGALISGAVAGVITGAQTKDLDSALKEAALSGSEGFKWGAITGALSGGASKTIELRQAAAAAAVVEGDPTAINKIPSWRESELAVLKEYGGTEQVSFLAGQEVPYGTPGATRPDIVRNIGNKLEAIEVKNYNLESPSSVNVLLKELEREVSNRVVNLPAGTPQRIVIDTTGRGFSPELINEVKVSIWDKLADIYPNIPIDIRG